MIFDVFYINSENIKIKMWTAEAAHFYSVSQNQPTAQVVEAVAADIGQPVVAADPAGADTPVVVEVAAGMAAVGIAVQVLPSSL